ncbi:rhamnulokinase [Pectinatus haikarae]|uniref:rhamnulokinase n=1 Tax=Pectinatus haikarae TaxID=349096 RepID=UPI0018C4F0C9
MKNYYLAIDIGASSGRHILGWMENGKMRIEEIYRFENHLDNKNGELCWDMERLFKEVVTGIGKCSELNRIPKSIGIDTWGVDFVLLDGAGEMLGEAVGYRDDRTKGMDKKVYEIINEKDLYSRNGIQKMLLNTIYHLYSLKLNKPELLEKAEHFLMIPEYLNYRLTGVMKNEYTNATTTQLVNAENRDWDWELLDMLGLPRKVFGRLYMPKDSVGLLKEEIERQVGFTSEVVLPATHDTGSAVMAVPTNDDDAIYISSGTWSLMGIERLIPDCTEKSRIHNFTNEGGYHYRYRYLKNIMGLWMMQSIRKEFSHKYTFDELFTLAYIGRYFSSVVDVTDICFLAPNSMRQAVQEHCRGTNQPEPQTECELLFCVYNSLAKCYGDVVKEIEAVTGNDYKNIYVVGGGCQDRFLNRLTAFHTQKNIYAGPVEATAIGNITAQMLKTKEFDDLVQARGTITKSFAVKKVNDDEFCFED